jgi:predicted membrane channel-forming protein YqfA (hemolysin III family)
MSLTTFPVGKQIDRDSKPRPLLRGWLHGLLTVLLVIFLIASVSSHTVGTVLGSREQQIGFIIGKLLSCGASASYHLVDFRSAKFLRWVNILDLLMVPVAVYALVSGGSDGSILGDDDHEKWIYNFYIILVVFALNAFGVWLEFRTEIPGDATVRSVIVIVYFIWGEFVCYGLAVGSTPFGKAISSTGTVGTTARLWVAQVITYLIGFSCGKVVDDYRMIEPVCFPHHRKGYYTLHEDFHNFVLIADLFGVAIFILAN